MLAISRWGTAVTLLISTVMAWFLIEKNIALIVWIGIGGMMAAFAGPLVVGGLWPGVTRRGAYAGLISGFTAFVLLHVVLQSPWIELSSWFGGPFAHIAAWLQWQSSNPFSCAAIGEVISIVVTVLVSKRTQPLPAAHLQELFGGEV